MACYSRKKPKNKTPKKGVLILLDDDINIEKEKNVKYDEHEISFLKEFSKQVLSELAKLPEREFEIYKDKRSDKPRGLCKRYL